MAIESRFHENNNNNNNDTDVATRNIIIIAINSNIIMKDYAAQIRY